MVFPTIASVRAAMVLAIFFAAWGRSDVASADQRPNLIVLLADDLGYGDIGCYGRDDIQTPVLDRLATQGTRFTAHYANGAECTPTRAAFMTGRYQQWIGGLECAIGTGNVGRYDDAIRLRETNDLGLPTQTNTIARLLKDSGYRTAITGKWHLGYEPKFAPHLHGFDSAYYCIGGEMDYFHYLDLVAGYNLFRDGQPIRDEGYFTDRIIDEAIEFVGQTSSIVEPFFLYVPFTAPHAPYQAAGDRRSHPLPLDSPLWKQSRAPVDVYRSMITRMDQQIGRLLKTLEEREIADDTLVIFASDNGGTASGRNDPFRGFKGGTFEGGIRVPLIVRWPGVVPAGATSNVPCMTFDLTATLATAAQLPGDVTREFEGIDLVEMLSGKGDQTITGSSQKQSRSDRSLYWRKPRGQVVWMGVRDGDWKYVAKRTGEKEQQWLFDLANDPSETSDLSRVDFQKTRALRAKFDAWERKTRASRRGRPGWLDD